MEDLQVTRYFSRLSYDGTAYHGWQIQPNAISIQEVLNTKVSLLLHEDIQFTGTGRTDAGVHAQNYIAHFDSINSNLELDKSFLGKINRFLPKDISIQSIHRVKSDAHARFDAIERGYEYYFTFSKDVFKKDYCVLLHKEPDFDLLNKASTILMEQDDFASFCKMHSDVKTSKCVLSSASWKLKGETLVFSISADRFLRNMVRAIVGTLMDVGNKKISLEAFHEIIKSKNRSYAGVSAPAKGLFFMFAKYPSHIWLPPM